MISSLSNLRLVTSGANHQAWLFLPFCLSIPLRMSVFHPAFGPVVVLNVHSVVQCGHLPIHLLAAYLHPCAYIGSDKHEVNTRILAAAASILEGLHGPALLVGGWKASADHFEPIRMLGEHFGYQDVALLCAL